MTLRKDLVLVGLLVAILMLMVVPLQQAVIDVLLAVNITLSVMLLMVAIYLRQPSDFSTFPTVILIGTAFRLALSIATTRLILSEADGGRIIETFGEFVVRGSVAIGLVIFLIITVIQFLVVTKGAERVAEVGARFALDALPGKQMSIDADIRAGTLDAATGEAMRRQLDRNSQFFGSMDGAMKFVKGDAIAGLIIIAINLVGGIAVGVTTHGLGFAEAGSVFSLLTIGDGLVAQIPALLMSLCAGIIVTRATNGDNVDLGTDIGRELLSEPRVPAVAAGIVLGIGLIPGFPFFVFAGAAGVLALAATLIVARIRRQTQADDEAQSAPPDEAPAEVGEGVPAPSQPAGLPVGTRFVLRLGAALAGAADMAALTDRLERRVAAFNDHLGLTFPRPGVEVSPLLGPWDLRIEIDGVPILRRTLGPETRLFAADPEAAREAGVPADQIRDLDWPGMVLVAIETPGGEAAARLAGSGGENEVPLALALCDAAIEMFEARTGQLLTRAELDAFLSRCSETDPEATQRLLGQVGRPAMMALLRHLVEDRVPVQPLPLVLEALQHWIEERGITDPTELADGLRLSLRRQICHAALGDDGLLALIMLDPDVETRLRRRLVGRGSGSAVEQEAAGLGASEAFETFLAEVRRITRDSGARSRHLALVVSADLRRRLRQVLATNDIHLTVLAPHEIAPDIASVPLTVLRS
ncbi:EscV/YscV/HrcV family type III secretion system export apparatus protein [Salipiger pallidus]|uniref:EscV/YscV/HrcV family type III secretion system export apparatus protein n=1 Tax=Salipiger pallidus TaxID=1775170 RepID=A0A8J2ZN99_9RHOB|nr:flagellar biosynthesis protein FlhA [Salipiger pallidus]GGG84000.1 EscV/YscV/HrcV family type III secretion system export apparatus protein [Salipiger pallidus]